MYLEIFCANLKQRLQLDTTRQKQLFSIEVSFCLDLWETRIPKSTIPIPIFQSMNFLVIDFHSVYSSKKILTAIPTATAYFFIQFLRLWPAEVCHKIVLTMGPKCIHYVSIDKSGSPSTMSGGYGILKPSRQFHIEFRLLHTQKRISCAK